MPELKLGFNENGQLVEEIMRPVNTEWIWQTSEEYVQEEIAQKRKKLAHIVAKANTSVQKDEVRKFTKEYEKYLAELNGALKMKFLKNFSPYCKLQLIVINGGSAPAQGVGVQIMFPKGASVITTDKRDDDVKIEAEVPDEPTLPEWAKQTMPDLIKSSLAAQSLLSAVSMISRSSIGSTIYRPAGFYKNTYYSNNFPFGRNTFEQRTDKLSHHEQWPIKPMIVYLPPNSDKGFSIEYTLYADELLEPITEELQVKWEQGT